MKKALFYIAYSVAALLVFAYLLFPGDTIAEYLENEAPRRVQGLDLSMESLELSLPLGLALNDVKLSREGRSLFAASQVTLSPKLLRLLVGKIGVDVKSNCYDGNIKLDAKFLERGATGPVAVEVRGESLDAKKMDLIALIAKQPVSGTLDFSASYQGPASQWTQGKGAATATLTDGKTGFLADLIGVKSFSVGKGTVEAELAQGTLSIKKCQLEGRELNGELSGTVALKQPLGRSGLSLSGSVTPTPALFQQLGSSSAVGQMLRSQSARSGGKIPFDITGTLAENDVEFRQ